MKKILAVLLSVLLLLASGCYKPSAAEADQTAVLQNAVSIVLSDDEITVNGKKVTGDAAQAVYAANDIVYYPAGMDFTFGEGKEADAHEASEADAHTVIHITQPGIYALSGGISAGQVAVDLGDDAEEDSEAVVTLVLNDVDITCTVAPAIIFYNVYECGDKDEDNADKAVDTSAAGANIVIADGTENNINGSYVARIYKPDSVELSEDGTEVEDAKKLHKYDAAFYSKMSMNIDGNNGILNITAENEGIDSELHLTVNGGNIRITSGNDGINTNEDGVSVTTINGGSLKINVTGTTGEGDGIDSNGWLVINGGTVVSEACAFSRDAGIDSDMGIYINGGTVAASGNMLDRISGGEQTYAVFNFAASQKGGNSYALKNADNEEVLSVAPQNAFCYLIVAADELEPGEYTFWCGDVQLAAAGGQGNGGFDGGRPEGGMGGTVPPEGTELPEGGFDGGRPEGGMGGTVPPEGMELPEGGFVGGRPEGGMGGTVPPEGMELPEGGLVGGRPEANMGQQGEASVVFNISKGANYFFVTEAQQA